MSPATASPPVFSIARGGPCHALLRRLRLIRGDPGDVLRQSIALVAITWLPLAAVGLGSWLLGRPGTFPLADLSVHARLLVAIPLFFVAERSLDRRCGRAVERFIDGAFAIPDDADRIPSILARAERLRDSTRAEAAMLGLAMLIGQLGLWAPEGRSAFVAGIHAGGVSAARGWYGFVALPAFLFLLARSLWRWAIWSQVLFRLSRLRLRPIPIHPDVAGGLGYLEEPSLAFAQVLMAVSAVAAGAWGSRIVSTDATLTSFAGVFAAFVVVGELLALGPLLLFSGHLLRARFEGLRQYSELALTYARSFHGKWIERRCEEPVLGSPDIQSLADLANSFAIVTRTRLVPFGPRAVVIVLLAMVLPMLPLILTEVSVTELVVKLGRTVLGGP